jgi:hypothetical protein
VKTAGFGQLNEDFRTASTTNQGLKYHAFSVALRILFGTLKYHELPTQALSTSNSLNVLQISSILSSVSSSFSNILQYLAERYAVFILV